jgi:hypothetical protein
VRAYSVSGTILRKDPYCDLYKEIFKRMEELAVTRRKAVNTDPVQ